MATSFKKDKGWKKFEKALNPSTFEKELTKAIKKATRKNGLYVQRAIRKNIKRGDFAANADLTVMIKSSNKPLVDYGSGLFQAITSKVIDETTVFIGIIQTSGEFNIAVALHEGATIKVTPAMRGLFLYLWKASQGTIPSSDLEGRAKELWERAPGGWLPLKKSTTVITIPERPFIEQVFDNKDVQKKVEDNWLKAINDTMHRLAQG